MPLATRLWPRAGFGRTDSCKVVSLNEIGTMEQYASVKNQKSFAANVEVDGFVLRIDDGDGFEITARAKSCPVAAHPSSYSVGFFPSWNYLCY